MSIIAATGAVDADSSSDVKDAFLADIAGVKEGPLALYRKQREEGLYRKVGALQLFFAVQLLCRCRAVVTGTAHDQCCAPHCFCCRPLHSVYTTCVGCSVMYMKTTGSW